MLRPARAQVCGWGAPAPTASGSRGRRGSHGEASRQLLGVDRAFCPEEGASALSPSSSASRGSWADSPSSPAAVPGLRPRHDQSRNSLMKGSLNVESLSY